MYNQTNKKERKTKQRTQYRKYSNIHAYITYSIFKVNETFVMDPSINFSDHLPITATLFIKYGLNITDNKGKISDNEKHAMANALG